MIAMTQDPTSPMSAIHWVLTLAGVWLATSSANAIPPASPELDRTGLEALTAELRRKGINDTEGSAVLAALLHALGISPADRSYNYRQNYPHLPDVDAVARKIDQRCAQVTLTIVPKTGRRTPVSIDGRYCRDLQRLYLWEVVPGKDGNESPEGRL